jgi:hypothetical protein
MTSIIKRSQESLAGTRLNTSRPVVSDWVAEEWTVPLRQRHREMRTLGSSPFYSSLSQPDTGSV